MSPAIKCLILLAVVALFFVTELIPLAITATAGAIACGLLGLIPAKQVFSGLSNSTVVLFAGMFVVGAAMFYTGLAQAIGEKVVHIFGTGENSLMLGLMLVGTILSSVLSNTGTCACLMPVALGICAASKNPASRQLLPMALLMDDSVYMLLQVQIAPQVIDEEKLKALAGAINNMNNNVRPFKFTVSERGDFMLNACITAENTTFNPALVNAIMGEAVKFMEAQYGNIMEAVWAK